ncbi:MAG TPA: N-acetyl-D-Glu racemase DgcA [Steroidobacter sp.]|uniref:N-acetyl-D-Glu racemase DgcA n=1 Tax=Steroidobacter sp. TaxID=1978227 RepID=UPI002EDA86F7
MTVMKVAQEYWRRNEAFRIAREITTGADLLKVEISSEGCTGRGECCPTRHYGETVDSVIGQIESVRDRIEAGAGRRDLHALLPAGAARNALDCALWDLEAKQSRTRAWSLAGLSAPKPILTAYTLGIDTPAAMGERARRNAFRPLLKIKLGDRGDLDRVAAVRAGAPHSRLIVDANEAWTIAALRENAPQLAVLGVELVEQPLPANADDELADYDSPVPLCADESCHTSADVDAVRAKYQFVNIKLDKTGGLTEALALAETARRAGLGLMVGCMSSTSLGIAPALLVAGMCQFVDLDAPLLQAEDRRPGLVYEGSLIQPAGEDLWG